VKDHLVSVRVMCDQHIESPVISFLD
jgi:hypothetical protein